MKLVELTKQLDLDKFVSSQPQAQFLQSWSWGEFYLGLGQEVSRFGVVDNNGLLAAATLIKKSLPIGLKYWYCPRGPIANSQTFLNFLITELKTKAKEPGIIFFRFEPRQEFDLQNFLVAPNVSGQPKFKIQDSLNIQPAKTLILDLKIAEDELLSAMHQKTRYNIRLAQKKGVVIRRSQADSQDIDAWWRMLLVTSQRDGFKLHSRQYYEQMLKLPLMKLWLAEYQGEVLAAAIIANYGDTTTYVHGASSDNNRQVMASYFLHWEIIKSAKSAGCHYYDFYGVDDKRWPGVSRFKYGFGGQIIKYPGTFDLVFNSVYYGIYQGLRWVRRRL